MICEQWETHGHASPTPDEVVNSPQYSETMEPVASQLALSRKLNSVCGMGYATHMALTNPVYDKNHRLDDWL